MCCRLRYTFSRGRSAVPLSLTRRRRWRRRRASRVSSCLIIASPAYLLLATGLAGLAANHFLGVLDPLALVRLRGPHPADARRRLAHELLVRAGHRDAVR